MNPLTYCGPVDPGPPPRGWLWYDPSTPGNTWFQDGGGDILIPWPPVLFGQEELDAAIEAHAEARTKGKAAQEQAP